MENNLSSIKPTLQYIRQQYKRFPKLGLATIFFGILAIVLSLIPAFFYRDIINLLSEASIASTEIAAHAIALLVYILWISISYAISSRLMDYCIITREMDMMEDLNNKVFDYIQKHSFQFFSNNFTGSLVAKIRKGVAGFERFTDTLMRGVVRFVVDCGLILVIIGFQYFRLAVAMFAAICASVWIQYRLFRRASPLQDKANALDTKFMGILSDNITNYLNIKIFSSLKKEATQFAKVNKENATARKKYHYKMTWVWGFARGGAGIVLEIGTIYAAIALRGQGVIAIGIIILLQIYVLRLIRQLWDRGHTLKAFFRCMSEIGELVELLNTPHEITDTSDKKLKIRDGHIRFDNVTFAYNKWNPIFDQLSFSIKPGERIGLVGPSGGGKTSIGKLLFRFYDIQGGRILVDNQDIADVTQESLRAQIGIVPQDPILFHRSLKENIIYGKPDSTEAEMIAAAKMARCHDFIDKLPHKYDTLVGERWIKLSGGERQRVAIARAILENSPIILLDEATSALDSESEHLIQEAMEQLMMNKTVIVIAHRLSTIMQMNKILVIEQWKIVEKGSHNELLLKNGTYANLRDIQSGGFLRD